MTNPQPNPIPSREALVLGTYDRLYDHDHCTADVVLVPVNTDGTPDWKRADPCNVEALPNDVFPSDHIDRACVIVSNVDGCSPDSTFLVRFIDDQPDLMQIHGATADHAVAEALIARDIGSEPPVSAASRLQESMAKLADSFARPAPANDNAPPITHRLRRLQQEYGGHIQADGIYGVKIGGAIGHILIIDDQPVFHPMKGPVFVLPEVKPVTARPFSLRDPASIPPRDWLYGKHYIRRYLTATVGAGGGGKSAHAISEALAMVTGRPLLDPNGSLTPPLRVWYINAEDPQDEIDRRFHAAVKHFDVTENQIGGRLFTDSGRDQEFVVMKQDGRGFKICQPLIDDMVAEIQRRRIDVVIIDPLVSTHEVPENDNSAMQRVAKAWTEVADRANCCVEVIHHVVKSKDEITADSARGGGALKDKTRGMRVLNPMTRAEAEKVGLEKPDGYFRIDHGKVNLVASGRSAWRHIASVPLGNGKGLLSTGDEIGVVEPWCWPSNDDLAERAAEQHQAVVADVPDELLAGLKVRLANGSYRESAQATWWAGDLVIELGLADTKDDAKAMIAAWVDAGELEIVMLPDAHRKLKPHIKPAAAL